MIPRQSLLNNKPSLFNDIKKSPYVGTKFYNTYLINNINNILPKHNAYLGYFNHGKNNVKINNKEVKIISSYFDPNLLLKVGKTLKEKISISEINRNPYIGYKVYSDIHVTKNSKINKTSPHIGYTKREITKRENVFMYDRKVFLQIGKELSKNNK